MIYLSYHEITMLAWQGKSKQMGDLADAFHNLPLYVESDDFSFQIAYDFLGAYHKKYPDTFYDYLGMLDKIVRDEKLDGVND